MAILTYDEVKDKASTLRAMTSLDREEFEQLAVVFGEVWNEQQAQAGKDAAKGGRPPELGLTFRRQFRRRSVFFRNKSPQDNA